MTMKKVALVTGGASGIGRAGCRLFAENGVALVVVDVNRMELDSTVEEIRGMGGEIHAIEADLVQLELIDQVVGEAADRFGGLDIIWNNAGVSGPSALDPVDLAVYERTIALNLTASILLSMASLPFVRRRGGGSIVFTSSISGLVGSQRNCVYSATKFGMIGFAKSLALQVAADGIRVNVVCPGPVVTPMGDKLIQQAGPDAAKEYIAKLVSGVPLGRIAEPREIAEAAYWLTTDGASYVTGVALPVDGGYTCR